MNISILSSHKNNVHEKNLLEISQQKISQRGIQPFTKRFFCLFQIGIQEGIPFLQSIRRRAMSLAVVNQVQPLGALLIACRPPHHLAAYGIVILPCQQAEGLGGCKA